MLFWNPFNNIEQTSTISHFKQYHEHIHTHRYYLHEPPACVPRSISHSPVKKITTITHSQPGKVLSQCPDVDAQLKQGIPRYVPNDGLQRERGNLRKGIFYVHLNFNNALTRLPEDFQCDVYFHHAIKITEKRVKNSKTEHCKLRRLCSYTHTPQHRVTDS